MDPFLQNNFVNVLINVTLENVTTTKIYMTMEPVTVNVKMIAEIDSCVRIIVKKNAKV